MKRFNLALLAFVVAAFAVSAMLVSCDDGSTSGSPPGWGSGGTTVPGTPTGVTASRNPADSTTITVSWNAVSGATGYRVYRSGTQVGSPTTNSYSSTGNSAATTYNFTVSAVNNAGEGVRSSPVSVGPASGGGTTTPTVPGAPTGVTASRTPAGSTTITVSWNAVSGALGYAVYYRSTGSGDGTLEGPATTTSFSSINKSTSATHYFRVTAINLAGESTPSSWVSVGPAATVPGAPTGVSAARNSAGSTIAVSWNAVSGATGYRVYYSTSNSGSGTLEGSPTTTSFSSSNKSTSATHYFRVTAVNSAGEGAASSWVSVGPVATTPSVPTLSAPTGVSVERDDATAPMVKMTVTWNAVSGAAGYKVYYRQDSGTERPLTPQAITATSYSVTDLFAVTGTHSFRVSTVNSAGVEGAKSGWVSPGDPYSDPLKGTWRNGGHEFSFDGKGNHTYNKGKSDEILGTYTISTTSSTRGVLTMTPGPSPTTRDYRISGSGDSRTLTLTYTSTSLGSISETFTIVVPDP